MLSGPDAVRHLLRVAAGLESFVLGERDIVRQVRTAAEASRKAGLGGLYLERLMASAVNTARRVHRGTRLSEDGRSVAAAAVRRAAEELGGGLEGRRVLVVGAGQVATEATVTAARLGAAVTVCNRTARHAAEAGGIGSDRGRPRRACRRPRRNRRGGVRYGGAVPAAGRRQPGRKTHRRRSRTC